MTGEGRFAIFHLHSATNEKNNDRNCRNYEEYRRGCKVETALVVDIDQYPRHLQVRERSGAKEQGDQKKTDPDQNEKYPDQVE
jgi:hypothetical protein